ncbi:MAG: uracil-DNA glycosylase [Betaproteobacteria bacterium]|nr:uracil-DNA glycosylase [Betaproteobacteria bacterium]
MQLDCSAYDPNCRDCSRLAEFLDQVRHQYPAYFCKPVPPFGPERATLLVVGLAPGMHGANASGRPFTGDWCSDLLYGTLYTYGFAKNPRSLSRDDDQALIDCRLTNAVKCLPPQNKPTPAEIKTCSKYLAQEINSIQPKVIVCLGAVAHDAVLSCLVGIDRSIKRSAYRFSHAAVHDVAGIRLIDSYHPSRYNTNTGRLTPEMFSAVFALVRRYV